MHTRQGITFQGSCTNSGILLGPVESHCLEQQAVVIAVCLSRSFETRPAAL